MAHYYLSNDATGVNSSFLEEAVQGDASFGAGITFFSSSNREPSSPIVNRIFLSKITGGTVPVARTLEKGNSRSSAASTTGHVSWTTIPTYSGNPLILVGEIEPSTPASFVPRHFQWWLLNPRYPIVLDPSGYIAVGTNTTEFNYPFTTTIGVRENTFNSGQRRIARRGRNPGFWHHKDYTTCQVGGNNTLCDRSAPEFYMTQALDWALSQMQQIWNINLFGASGPTTFNQSVDGAITPSGTLLKQANKLLAGTITPSGGLLKQVNKIFTGAITPTGALLEQLVKLISVSGSITPTGTLTKQINKSFTGGITFVGTLVKLVSKNLTGAITPTGALVKQISKTFTGVLTFTGTLVEKFQKLQSLTGVLSFSGALATVKNTFVAGGAVKRWLQTKVKGSRRRGGK